MVFERDGNGTLIQTDMKFLSVPQPSMVHVNQVPLNIIWDGFNVCSKILILFYHSLYWQEDENRHTDTQTDRWYNPLMPDVKNTTVTDE